MDDDARPETALGDPLTTVRRRLAQQRLVGASFERPAEAVHWLGAVQAQEYAEAKWSLGQRTGDCTDADVEAACDRGEILRTHVLRPTWHFVTPADIRWLLQLTGPRVQARSRSRYAELGLDGRTLVRAHEILHRTLDDGEPRTRAELAGCLQAGGVDTGGQRLPHLLMSAELEQLICSGPRRVKSHTYTLLDRRAPLAAALPREAAVAELVLRYFRSHGPATVDDFTSWSSLTVADAKAGLDLVGDHIAWAEDEHHVRWYADPTGVDPGPVASMAACLVPTFDETLVAYRSVRAVLSHAGPQSRFLDRAVVIDGVTVGTWRRALAKNRVVVDASLYGPLTPEQSEALAAVTERFGRYLGLPAELRTSAGT